MLGFLLLVTAGWVAVSGQSLWIDEANTALKAGQATLTDWWRTLVSEKGSDLQMPLYMLWIWACEKCFGSEEFALRAVNLFWFVPGVLAFARALAGRRDLQKAVLQLAAVSPFAAYYLNEARPYAMQLGATFFLLAALCRWSRLAADEPPGRGWTWGFVFALVALAGSSLLGMIWAAAALAAVLVVWPWRRWLELFGKHFLAWLFAAAALAALAKYYLWTLKTGARASAVATTDWRNVVFAGYELLGFAGLGPGRAELRGGGLAGLRAQLPALAVYAALAGGFLIWGLVEFWRSRRWGKFLAAAMLVGLPAAMILAAGATLHFRVLGRHLAPLAVVAVALLAAGLAAVRRSGFVGNMLAVAFLALSLLSAALLRFAPWHAKEDYRGAADVARRALKQGKTVWWNADVSGARFYQLPVTTNASEAGKAVWLMNPAREQLVGPPDLVLASRRDIYDAGGTLAEFLAREKFERVQELQSFTVWRRAKKD